MNELINLYVELHNIELQFHTLLQKSVYVKNFRNSDVGLEMAFEIAGMLKTINYLYSVIIDEYETCIQKKKTKLDYSSDEYPF